MTATPEPKDLFICHNGSDKAWAKKLGARVEAETSGGRPLTVFIDEWDIDLGENILLKLDAALANCRFIAVLMSPEMLGSEWCRLEFTAILSQDPTNRAGRLIPVRLRDFHNQTKERLELPPILRALNWIDFRDERKFEDSFKRLLAKIRGEKPPRGAPGGGRQDPLPPLVRAGFTDRRDAADEGAEGLIGNLLPVRAFPQSIWGASTRLRLKSDLGDGPRLPPFILRENRLYALNDLSDSTGPFAAYVTPASTTQHSSRAWQADAAHSRWLVQLLNLCLQNYLRPEIEFDRHHYRFWFVPQGSQSVKLKWGSGSKKTVVRAPGVSSGRNWIHHAARLRFESIDTSLYLSVDPSYVFTTDGRTPVSADATRPLAAQWGGRERNGTILRHVLMWADAITRGKRLARIPAGDQFVEIEGLPATVETPVTIYGDRVQVKSLVRFSGDEWDLDPPFTFIIEDDGVADSTEEQADDA